MRAVLFDFDGVLVDSTPAHLRGWAHAYRQMFKEELDEATLTSLIGRSTAAIGSLLARKSGYDAAKAELIRKKVAWVLSELPAIALIPGADRFIIELARRRIPCGIVSNAPRDFIAAALQRHQLDIPFYLGLEDYYRPKPDAEPYMKGAARLGWNFSEHAHIYVFEDSTHGIEAAVAAHMTPIGICSQHPPAPLLAAGAQLCFADLAEAHALLPTMS